MEPRTSWNRWLLLVCLAAAQGGCGVSDIYSANGPKPQAAALSKRPNWRVSGDLKDPAKAVDGDVNTAALSGRIYANASLTIDLGKPCVFNMVIIDHGPNETGFCGRVAVLTSLDGTTFTHRHTAPGTRRVTIASLIAPALARYVRLQAVQEGSEPWSVAEVYLQ